MSSEKGTYATQSDSSIAEVPVTNVSNDVPNAHYVSSAAPGGAVPVSAVIVSSSSSPYGAGSSLSGQYTEATVVEATPVLDVEDAANAHTMKSMENLAYAIMTCSFVHFILGCATMNYLGYGPGAWYAALFQFFSATIIICGMRVESCNLRNMVVCSLVVTIIAVILTFIGMLADFVWYGYAKAQNVCDETAVVQATYTAELANSGLSTSAGTCDRKCLAALWMTDDHDGDTFCYDHNWGDCNDFCDGDFPHLAGVCGGFGLISFFMIVTLSISLCCGLCNQRRY